MTGGTFIYRLLHSGDNRNHRHETQIPHITMTMNPRTVKVMLEAMEGFLDAAALTSENNDRLQAEVKDVYADVALRLSQAGRNIAQCHHCNRARYYSGMVLGGSSKKKILEILGGILMIWRVKLVREKAGRRKSASPLYSVIVSATRLSRSDL